MSLLLALGQPDAADYTVGQVWVEAALYEERQRSKMVDMAVVIQMATSTTGMVASKESHKAFKEFIEDMQSEG